VAEVWTVVGGLLLVVLLITATGVALVGGLAFALLRSDEASVGCAQRWVSLGQL
jgi:hypothetical protein